MRPSLTELLAISDPKLLVPHIAAARDAYYNLGTSPWSDADYDVMLERLSVLQPGHPFLEEVGAAGMGSIVHVQPMLSLDKVTGGPDVVQWMLRSTKCAATETVWIEPKIDGVSLELRYEAGILKMAVTRGNGLAGENVTTAARRIQGVPERLTTAKTLRIRGEVYMPLSLFRAYGNQLKHPRNAVVGTLGSPDGSSVPPNELAFFAYDALGLAVCSSPRSMVEVLTDLGLTPAPAQIRRLDAFPEFLQSFVPEWRRSWDFEADGLVVKLQDFETRAKLGATAHHPHWAVAYKFPAEEALATLQDVEWQVARTQTITPVAVFAPPVRIAGADITNATLHNWSTFAALDLHKGDTVLVSRRGGVIPHIERLVHAGRGDALVAPATCPSCGTIAERVVTGDATVLRCTAGMCGGAVARQVEHWCKAIGADGFGPKVCAVLVKLCGVDSVYGLYHVDWTPVAAHLGAGVARNLRDNLTMASRGVPADKVLVGLGLPGLGEVMARKLAATYNFQELFDALPEEMASSCPGLGLPTALGICAALEGVVEWLSVLVLNQGLLTVSDVKRAVVEGAWTGQTVCFTGELPVDRGTARGAAERLGAVVVDNVTRKTTILVQAAGDSHSTKARKAQELIAKGQQLEVWPGERFMQFAFASEKS